VRSRIELVETTPADLVWQARGETRRRGGCNARCTTGGRRERQCARGGELPGGTGACVVVTGERVCVASQMSMPQMSMHVDLGVCACPRDSHSMLAAMFSSRHPRPHQNGAIFIDRDGTRFRHVLNYLRDGVLHVQADFVLCAHPHPRALPPRVLRTAGGEGVEGHPSDGCMHADHELLDEAEYFALDGMKEMLLELIDALQENTLRSEASARKPPVDPFTALLPLLLCSQSAGSPTSPLTDIPGLAVYLQQLQDPKPNWTFQTDIEF
jgi:hypothetical protein